MAQTEVIKVRLVTEGFKRFFNVMGQNMEQFKRFTDNGRNASKAGGRLATRVRDLTHGMRGFRMEMLGVMFFGMAMLRFFKGMLQPALELTGVFEIWRTTLQLLFLPIALLLLDLLMPIAMWLMNLSDNTKLLIGKLVLFGAAIGVVLLIVGTFALGIGSVILAFGGLFSVIDGLIPDINILGVNISSFVEAALGISAIALVWSLFKDQVNAVLDLFLSMSFVEDLMNKIGFSVDNAKTPWENFKELIKTIFNKLIGDENSIFGKFSREVKFFMNVTLPLHLMLFKAHFRQFKEDIDEKTGEIDFEALATSLEELGNTLTEMIEEDGDLFIEFLEKAVRIMTAFINAINKIRNSKPIWDKIIEAGLPAPYPGSPFPSPQKQNDFIWRAGSGPVAINPNDNLVGTKGGMPGGNGVTINNNLTVTGSLMDEVKKLLDENNEQLVTDIRRLTPTGT